jgi:hypothetical protein
MIVA